MLLYILGLDGSQPVVGSEDSVALGIATAKAETNAQPHGEGSSSKEEHRRQDASAKTEACFDEGVGENNVPLG